MIGGNSPDSFSERRGTRFLRCFFLCLTFLIGVLIMTESQFITECVKRTIDPQIAIENEELCEALRDRDDDEIIRILNEEF